jgi:2,4-dienoyl-CoA reductase-like NADH-dependent reductase (Old Yellow Enzyme family)/thioredoxin reductase
MPESTETEFPTLLSPLRVGSIELRNRVVVTAHGTTTKFRDPDMSPGQYIEYVRRRAAGGVGLFIAQPVIPNPLVPITAETVDRHGRLVEAVRAEGAALLLQLAHLGLFGRTDAEVGMPPLWSFEEGQSLAGEASHRMTDEEIEAVVAAYRDTARFAAEVGFDGVEVHAGHGYLIQQSLTPATNSRDDRWGQDRTLFARSIVKQVREAIGPDGVLSFRTATDDLISPAAGGRGAAQIARDLGRILSGGGVDMVNTTVGDGNRSYTVSVPGYRYPEAPNISFLDRLRSLVDIDVPVVGVGGIVSPAVAEKLLSNNQCDLVAMTRAHIADPDLVAKVRSGQSKRVRPCVRANLCVDRRLAGTVDIGCMHNPEVLREHEFAATPAPQPKRVIVVGSGPAGLKAAEIAARRGHRVEVFEAGSVVGGQLRLAEHTAAARLTAALDYLASELVEAGVTLHLETPVDASLLRDSGADSVILATGARSRTGGEALPGGETGRVLSMADALTSEISGDVLVYDGMGTSEAALVAETLHKRGCRVTFATSFEVVAPFVGPTQRWEIPSLLRNTLEAVHVSTTIESVDKDVVHLVRESGRDRAFDERAHYIVAVVPPVPNTGLATELTRLQIPHQLVGDAKAPRTAWQAFTEGQLAGLAV